MKGRVVPYLSLILFLLLSACNLPFGLGSRSGNRNPDRMKLSPGDTAAALSDHSTAEDGIWSLLARLGIGVYTGDGTQIMPGSETEEGDFWLYDFEVESLARMATQKAIPFSRYHTLLSTNGYPGTEADLLARYRETYTGYPDHPFVQLLYAMDVDFSNEQTLTPLQTWLLLLDSFVPPNGAEIAETRRIGGGHLAAQEPPRQGIPCGEITGGGIIPFWGLLQSEADWTGYFAAVEMYYAIHGPMLASAVNASLNSSASKVHEGHNEEGSRVEYTVDVQIDYVPLPTVVVGAISCGALVNSLWQPLVGGFKNVPVDWQDPLVFVSHAELEEQEHFTNNDGKAKMIFQLQEEEAAGIGPYREEEGLIYATLDMKTAFLGAGITDPRLLVFIPAEMKVGPEEVQISWHDTCDEFTIFFSEVLNQDAAIFSHEISIEGPIPVNIHSEEDPVTLEGSAELHVVGEGQLDDCSFLSSGMDKVTVSGTTSPGEGDDPPMLHMKINHSIQITMQGNQCGGGIPIPIPSGEFSLEMPLRDGEMAGGDFNQPMVVGLTTYDLEVHCGD